MKISHTVLSKLVQALIISYLVAACSFVMVILSIEEKQVKIEVEPISAEAEISSEYVAPNEYDFYPDDESFEVADLETYPMYTNKSSVYYRSSPVIMEETQLGTLGAGKEVAVIGEAGSWSWCLLEDRLVYIHSDLLVDEYIPDKRISPSAATVSSYAPGNVLTARKGKIVGPSGEETYYNLNMKNIVSRLKDRGYEGEYWIREDGAKMFGDYVMVAADFSTRPIGTLLETSLGTGIVCDTGSFVEYAPTRIDIATNW